MNILLEYNPYTVPITTSTIHHTCPIHNAIHGIYIQSTQRRVLTYPILARAQARVKHNQRETKGMETLGDRKRKRESGGESRVEEYVCTEGLTTVGEAALPEDRHSEVRGGSGDCRWWRRWLRADQKRGDRR